MRERDASVKKMRKMVLGETFNTSSRRSIPIDTCPWFKSRIVSVIVNDGHRSGVGNTILIFLPIITRLCRILVGTIGCWRKEFAATLGSLLEEIVLFIWIIPHPSWIIPTETLCEANNVSVMRKVQHLWWRKRWDNNVAQPVRRHYNITIAITLTQLFWAKSGK